MGEESGTGEFVVPNDSDFALTQCMQKFAGCLERKDFGGMGTALKEALDICCSSDEDM